MSTEAFKLRITGGFPEYSFVAEVRGTATSISDIRDLLRGCGVDHHLPTSQVQSELSRAGAFEMDLSSSSEQSRES